MLVKDVIQKTTVFFRDKGFESARLDTELLISTALRWERMKLYLNYEYPLSDDELATCRELVRRRSSGEPVAYILGFKDFYSHTFKVSPAVLIPRPETETIVEKATEWLNKNFPAGDADSEATEPAASPRVIDFGTGSGCIGLSILCEAKTARLLAVDASEGAVGIARENAELLVVADRAEILTLKVEALTTAQVEKSLGGLADVVVANPPYISPEDPNIEKNVKMFEPASALFSEDSGLAHVKAWALKAGEVSRAGAFIMFEIGWDQGPRALAIFEQTGLFTNIRIEKDLAGHERFVCCERVSRGGVN